MHGALCGLVALSLTKAMLRVIIDVMAVVTPD